MSSPETDAPWRPELVPGERIFLSQVRREDLPLYARWFSDLELTTYLGAIGTSFMPEHEQEWYDHVVADKVTKAFAIVVREGQQLIGNVDLHNVNHRHGTAELGIAIGEKEAWGKGYGSEAARLICDYGFAFLGLHAIALWHVAFNERGHRAYLKAGFKLVGRRREAVLFSGKRYDDMLMDITREEFGPSRLQSLIGQLDGDRAAG
jgi:RimJ/RimL family protein N-acetyltransferase